MIRLRPVVLPQERDIVLRSLRDSDPEDYLLSLVPAWKEGEGHLLLEDSGTLLGLATLEDLGEEEAWIGGIRIALPFRGQGLGSRLLEGLISRGWSQGLRVFRALVERENHASHALFRRHGFLEVGRFTLQSGSAEAWPSVSPIQPVDRKVLPRDLRPGWAPERYGRVDRVGPLNVGRFVRWRGSLLERWAEEGIYYLTGAAAWLARPWGAAGTGSLWVSPLSGELEQWIHGVSQQAGTLGFGSWEAFLPETTEDLEAYRRAGLRWAGSWGESTTLYERDLSQAEPGQAPS